MAPMEVCSVPGLQRGETAKKKNKTKTIIRVECEAGGRDREGEGGSVAVAWGMSKRKEKVVKPHKVSFRFASCSYFFLNLLSTLQI